MTSTPEQKREAWVSLMEGLQRSLISTRENAKTYPAYAEAMGLAYGMDMAKALQGYDATAWAAHRLLQALLRLEPPVVPVDDTKGQGSILDELAGASVGWRDPAPRWTAEDHARLVADLELPSTPGENPGDERPCGDREPHDRHTYNEAVGRTPDICPGVRP